MSATVRPRTITIAIIFFAATLVLQVAAFIIDYQQLFSPAGQSAIDQALADSPEEGDISREVLRDIAQTTALVMLCIGAFFNVVLTLLVVLLIGKGRGSGRIIATLLTAASIVFLLLSWGDRSPMLDLLSSALLIVAVVYLWLPSSAEYFRVRKADRHREIYAS